MDLFGLPLHPLIVHAAVILVPLAALGALLLVALPRLRSRYGTLTVAFAAAAAASALAAFATGPLLVQSKGLEGSPRIAAHMQWGTLTPWPVIVLAVAFPLFLRAAGRRATNVGPATPVAPAAVVAVAAVASLVLIALTGHAGATAVWGP